MKRKLTLAAGFALLLAFAFTLRSVHAQVYSDFEPVMITQGNYVPLADIIDPIDPDEFVIPFNQKDLDDGYAMNVPLGFDFEFDGEVYNSINICINGFVTFADPPSRRSREPLGLFINASSYPTKVVAPYWGDHHFRTSADVFDNYLETEIRGYYDDIEGVFTVEWRNLNINYLDNEGQPIKSSVGSFQVKFYESSDQMSEQGDIEFCYGNVGGNDMVDDNRIVVEGASVGVKGGGADFVNGIEYDEGIDVQRTSQRLTNEWEPSGADNNRISFIAKTRYNIREWWGDGDVDFSKGAGRKHEGMPQSRFVTVNDVRQIMVSMATHVPLDSVRYRNAYHGDVNHNGRYYYDNDGVRQDIPWRSEEVGDDLPQGIENIRRIFFQVSEYDASLILHYMSARIIELPWLLDTIPQYGKIVDNELLADNIRIEYAGESAGDVRFAVYPNGYVNGPLGINMQINGSISDVLVPASEKAQTMSNFDGNTVIISGTGEYNVDEPICFVTANVIEDLRIEKIRFNDIETGSMVLDVEETENDGDVITQSYPNPAVDEAFFNVNFPVSGNYEIAIFDMLGNKIKTLEYGSFEAGSRLIEWDLRDQAGSKVNSGMYMYRLQGAGYSVSGQMTVAR